MPLKVFKAIFHSTFEMSTIWQSDKKDWNYPWQTGGKRVFMDLWRYHAALAPANNSATGMPSFLLAKIDLYRHHEKYVPVLKHDAVLEENGARITYVYPSSEDEAHSLVCRYRFSDLGDALGELGKNRKRGDVPGVIELLRAAEKEFKARKLGDELNMARAHRQFCEVLVLNNSGLHVF